jgi:hypothetical protein
LRRNVYHDWLRSCGRLVSLDMETFDHDDLMLDDIDDDIDWDAVEAKAAQVPVVRLFTACILYRHWCWCRSLRDTSSLSVFRQLLDD